MKFLNTVWFCVDLQQKRGGSQRGRVREKGGGKEGVRESSKNFPLKLERSFHCE